MKKKNCSYCDLKMAFSWICSIVWSKMFKPRCISPRAVSNIWVGFRCEGRVEIFEALPSVTQRFWLLKDVRLASRPFFFLCQLMCHKQAALSRAPQLGSWKWKCLGEGSERGFARNVHTKKKKGYEDPSCFRSPSRRSLRAFDVVSHCDGSTTGSRPKVPFIYFYQPRGVFLCV